MAGTKRIWSLPRAAAAIGVGAVSVVAAVMVMAPQAEAQVPGLTVTVEPAQDLGDGDWVTITVAGVEPGRYVQVAQCRTGAVNHHFYCDITDRITSTADSEGIAVAQLRVDAILTVGNPGDPGYGVTDCRVAEACIIGVVEQISAALTPAPLHFDPDAEPAPPPDLSVTPDSQLEDLQTVTAAASGLVWSNRGYIAQCAANPTSLVGDCSRQSGDLVFFQTTDGQVSTDYQVKAVIETDNHGTVDCQVPGSCVLAVTQDQFRIPERSAIAPLSFGDDTGNEPPGHSCPPGRRRGPPGHRPLPGGRGCPPWVSSCR